MKDLVVKIPESQGANSKIVLNRLFSNQTIIIGVCDGAATFRQSEKIFKSGISSPDERDFDIVGEVTKETPVQVWEMSDGSDATFAQIFGFFGADLNKICLTPHQIILFCVQHFIRLLANGFATYFLFKRGSHFCVAAVMVTSLRLNLPPTSLSLRIHPLDFDGDWSGKFRRRIVVPELKKTY
jgi:hypothetical protein